MDNILRNIVIKIGKIFKADLSDDFVNNLMQFIKFGMVGVSNTVISYVLNISTLILLHPLQVKWDYIVGNLVSFTLSVLWSFFWNNRYVFTLEDGEHRPLLKTLLKTYVSYGFTGILLNNLMSSLWINIFHISKFIAPLINLTVSVPLNFMINKFWAYKK